MVVKFETKHTIGADHRLTVQDIRKYVFESTPIELSEHSYHLMENSYQFLKSNVNARVPVYGINTNFGDQVSLVDRYLNNKDENLYYDSINARQENIIKSLSCSQGPNVKPEITKATLLIRAHCLAQGYSGVAPTTVQAILDYFNAGIAPIVRRYGSIGASGDLIPLGTIAAGMLGANVNVFYQNKIMPATMALQLAGLKKFKPELRDGLALINGTSFMTAISSLAFYELKRLFNQMLSAIAMALEAMTVIDSAYNSLVHQVKLHRGEIKINSFFTDFWNGSQLLTNLDQLRNQEINTRSLQDYYSLRAVPQGFGPFQENLERAGLWIEDEINSVNDNPIIDVEKKKIYHNANFMGYYVTDACDILKMNIGQASTWIHALLANLLHSRKNHDLPTNLAMDPNKHNGFRSLQLLAAALAVQNRKLAQSHQSFTLPTEGDNQDVNSLGTHAAFDFTDSVENLECLTAILFITSAQALELRGIKKACKNSQVIFEKIRQVSPQLIECRVMDEEIISVIKLLKSEII